MVPQTEDRFVDEVQGSGVLVYLSATWLRELYQQVLANDLIGPANKTEHALVHLLSGGIIFLYKEFSEQIWPQLLPCNILKCGIKLGFIE